MGMHTRASRYWEWAYNLDPKHPYFQQENQEAEGKALETVGDIGGSIKGLFEDTKGLLGRFGKKS